MSPGRSGVFSIGDGRNSSWYPFNGMVSDVRIYVLCFEDLNIEAMKRLWGRKVSDLGFADFLMILEAKANEYRKTLVKIGRFEASSKTCSSCGSKNDSLSLKDRLFQCPHCGLEVDRDHNAALNIRSWGINSWARGSKTDSSASLV